MSDLIITQIPQELKNLNQWVTYKLIPRDNGKTDKPLFTPSTGNLASHGDPKTWASFEEAVRTLQSSNGMYQGIGFVFNYYEPYCGIDFDGCRNPETGEIDPEVLNHIKKLNSYTEVSPSDRGIHVIVKAKLPGGGRKNTKKNIEVYDTLRYFTVTGQCLEEMPFTINDRQKELNEFYKEIFEKKTEKSDPKQANTSMNDSELIEKARNAKNGHLFSTLFAGSWEAAGYPSQSEADQALCNMLAFWTGNNASRIDTLFRQSGLYREKWGEKHFGDGRTYGQATIQKAIDSTTETYRPEKENQSKPDTEKPKKPVAEVICLANVKPQKVVWLWNPYIPKGKLTLVEGDPSVGKTWLMLMIAAIISNGWPLPGQTGILEGVNEPGNVLYMSGEDGLADTLRPRLDNLEADVSRIHVLTGSRDEKGKLNGITLSDLEVLEEALERVKPVLLVVDPLQAYLGARVDMHRANEVRPVLAGLAALAEKHGCAAVCIRHLSKSSQNKTIYRGLGTIDFAAAARSILLVGQDPENEQKRAIIQTKNSLEKIGAAIAYGIDEGKFSWRGLSDMTASTILSPQVNEEERSAISIAKDFLEDILQEGTVPSEEIFKEAKKQRIADRTLNRAKSNLNINSQKIGKTWYWELPEEEKEENELEI